MQTENGNLIIALNNTILPLCDWFFLPVGLIWYSFLQNTDIMTVIISTVVFYIIFQIFCYLANFLISILYLIFMPICLIFQKVKEIVSLLHVAFCTIWALAAYYFAINFDTNYIKPISLVLYAGITLPFVRYGQRNYNNISDIELTYIAVLKVAALISCLALLIFNVDIYTFGIIFVISYLCGVPFIKDVMED